MIDGLKGENVLRPLIVQNREVLLLQPPNRRSRFIRHLHIEGDLPGRVKRSQNRRPRRPGLELRRSSVWPDRAESGRNKIRDNQKNRLMRIHLVP